MKYWFYIAVLFTCAFCAAGEKPSAETSKVSKNDLHQAQKEFQRAVDLQKQGRLEEALTAAASAASLVPSDMAYLTAREMLRSQLAGRYIERGNLLAEIGDKKGATGEFKNALNIDPGNAYAQERLHDVDPAADDPEHQKVLQLLASVDQISVAPKPGHQNFHLRGDARELYNTLGKAFGLTVAFDEPLNSRQLRFDVDDIGFYEAMDLAGKMTKTAWAPLANNQIIVFNDTLELRRQFQRMSLKTFYLSDAVTPADLSDVSNAIRAIFDVKFIGNQPNQHIITIRAPKENMDAISGLMEDLLQARPELLLEVKAYEINETTARQTGLELQNSFQVFNVASEIRKVLGNSAQPVIDSLLRSGTVDPSQIPASALGNLQNSPLLLPFLFFGNGVFGLTGIVVAPIKGVAVSSESLARTLEHVTMRTSDGTPVTLRLGDRLPIQTSSFTNVSISQGGKPVVSPAIPAVQYEDLGVTFNATPHLHSSGEVTLDLDLQFKGLGAENLNGVPSLTNRAYTGNLTVGDGEPALVAGMVTDQLIRTTNGYPAVGQAPLLSEILNSNSKTRSKSQILIVVTPHIIRKPFRNPANSVFWNVAK